MEFTTIAIQYLKACNIFIGDAFFNQQMQSHPDYPSLLSFTIISLGSNSDKPITSSYIIKAI